MDSSHRPAASNVVELTHFRADIQRSLLRRGQKLLTSTDIAAAMVSLPPLEAYFIIKEVGLEEASPLLTHATVEQVQACIDLDCWVGDSFLPAELDAWLAPAQAEGARALATAFFRLDEEVQLLSLAAHLSIYDVRSEEAPPVDDDVMQMTTPDNIFTLHMKDDPERLGLEVEPFILVKALYDHTPETAMQLLMAAKWELMSTVVEEGFQFRQARLADLGFPDPSDAAKLFAPPPSQPPSILFPPDAADLATLPALYAAPMNADSLFTQAMGRLPKARLSYLENSLLHLINAALIAYGESPRDIAHTAQVVERVRDMLSLGLEALLPEGAERDHAAQLLETWPLTQLFAHGHQVVRPLQKQALRLQADPVAGAWLNLAVDADTDPEAQDRAFLRSLCSRRPLWSGFDPLRPERAKAFARCSEVDAASQRLQALAARLL